MTPDKVEKMTKALMRSNTHLLLSAVTLFQAAAMLLIAFQKEAVNPQALILAAALPLVTWLVTALMGRVWPVDRAILILVMLLCSVGLITLSDIARADVTPRTQAYYALAGVAAMSRGDGRYSATASASGWMPTSRLALPRKTGTSLRARVRRRISRLRRSSGTSSPSR